MLEMEMMQCYAGWITYKCPECGSEEVNIDENSPCYGCGSMGMNCENVWESPEGRLNFHKTGKTST